MSHVQHCLDAWTLLSIILFNSYLSPMKANGKAVCSDSVSFHHGLGQGGQPCKH